MDFSKITLNDKQIFDSYVKDELSWEYNFATIFEWAVYDNLHIGFFGGIMLLYTVIRDKIIFMPPYLKDAGDFPKAIKIIEEYCASVGQKVRIRGITRDDIGHFSEDKFILKANRDDFDYIYASDDLKYLRGKAFHSKRNFVNRFTSLYNYSFEDYKKSDNSELMGLFDIWMTESSHETLSLEKMAIIRALDNFVNLDLKIGVLRIDGAIKGYSVSSINPNGVIHTCFEKADTQYAGIYQAINYAAANRYFEDEKLVNRQEDMGIEGLRKAKLSYNPQILLEKFFAEEK